LLEGGSEVAEVVLIARGAHGAAIRERGLRLDVDPVGGGAATSVQTAPGAAEVYSSIEEAIAQGARLVDFMILAVKTWQVAEAAAAARPLLGDAGCVVTTQNGVEAPQQAADVLGAGRVLGGVAKVLAYIAEPGVVSMKAQPAFFHFGEAFAADGSPLAGDAAAAAARSARAERLAGALAHCQGVTSGIPQNGTWPMLWEKAVLMCSFGPVAALCRAPLDKVCGIPETRALLRAAMLEVASCAARARHLEKDKGPEEVVDAVLATLTAQGVKQPGVTPSTLRDVVMGKPSEINELSGGIARAGRKLGVATPTHDLILAALLPQELRARGEQPYQLMGVPGGAPHVRADLRCLI